MTVNGLAYQLHSRLNWYRVTKLTHRLAPRAMHRRIDPEKFEGARSPALERTGHSHPHDAAYFLPLGRREHPPSRSWPVHRAGFPCVQDTHAPHFGSDGYGASSRRPDRFPDQAGWRSRRELFSMEIQWGASIGIAHARPAFRLRCVHDWPRRDAPSTLQFEIDPKGERLESAWHAETTNAREYRL